MKHEVHFSRRLNDADAKFFFMGQRPECNVAMVMAAVLSSEISMDRMSDALTPYLGEISRFTDYLRQSPLNIAPPVWMPVPEDNRDPDDYAKEIRMPPGSTWGDVFARIDTIQSESFHPDRAAWQVALIQGAPGGRSVLVLKVHHALSDGMALAILFAKAFAGDLMAEANAQIEVITEPPPRASRLRMALSHQAAAWRRWLGLVARSLPEWSSREGRRREARVARRILRPQMRWALGSHCTERRLSGYRVPISAWREEAQVRGGGTNDLYLAIVGRVMRESFRSLNFDTEPLRIVMPVGMREDNYVQDGHNTAAVCIVELSGSSAELADLTMVSKRAKDARENAAAPLPSILEEGLKLLPGSLRAAIDFRQAAACDVVATNVPIPLEGKLEGVPIEMMFMVAPSIGQAASFSLATYGEDLYLVSNSDCGIAPPLLDDRVEETLTEIFGDRFEGFRGESAQLVRR